MGETELPRPATRLTQYLGRREEMQSKEHGHMRVGVGSTSHFDTVLDQGIWSRNLNFHIFANLQCTNAHELLIREDVSIAAGFRAISQRLQIDSGVKYRVLGISTHEYGRRRVCMYSTAAFARRWPPRPMKWGSPCPRASRAHAGESLLARRPCRRCSPGE